MGNNQSKKVRNNYFFKNKHDKPKISFVMRNKMRLKSGAIQGEFGEKKFIKP
tara:strand:+ start:22 stop:177 length:156 start_codon:yes stop_codon:yes gene_type:complete